MTLIITILLDLWIQIVVNHLTTITILTVPNQLSAAIFLFFQYIGLVSTFLTNDLLMYSHKKIKFRKIGCFIFLPVQFKIHS